MDGMWRARDKITTTYEAAARDSVRTRVLMRRCATNINPRVYVARREKAHLWDRDRRTLLVCIIECTFHQGNRAVLQAVHIHLLAYQPVQLNANHDRVQVAAILPAAPR